MRIYNYDDKTRVLTTESDARPDPLIEGSFLIPANATNVTPPKPINGFTFVFINNIWVKIEDHRGNRIYNKTTGEELTVTDVGPISPEYTDVVFVPKSTWNDATKKWELSLDIAINDKVVEINKAAAAQIINGFSSSALGSVHEYQSDITDQLNLIGVVTAGENASFKAGVTQPDGSVVWSSVPHTIAELTNVLRDGKAYKKTILDKASALKALAKSAATAKDVNAISW